LAAPDGAQYEQQKDCAEEGDGDSAPDAAERQVEPKHAENDAAQDCARHARADVAGYSGAARDESGRQPSRRETDRRPDQ